MVGKRESIGAQAAQPAILDNRFFLLSQGYGIIENLLLQDNKSSILLERNGRASSGKRTRHINIRYFFITDRVNMKEISIDWCPTKKMVDGGSNICVTGDIGLLLDIVDVEPFAIRCARGRPILL